MELYRLSQCNEMRNAAARLYGMTYSQSVELLKQHAEAHHAQNCAVRAEALSEGFDTIHYGLLPQLEWRTPPQEGDIVLFAFDGRVFDDGGERGYLVERIHLLEDQQRGE